jgi:hypothetical protein
VAMKRLTPAERRASAEIMPCINVRRSAWTNIHYGRSVARRRELAAGNGGDVASRVARESLRIATQAGPEGQAARQPRHRRPPDQTWSAHLQSLGLLRLTVNGPGVVHVPDRRPRASRMRQPRTSGLMRGEDQHHWSSPTRPILLISQRILLGNEDFEHWQCGQKNPFGKLIWSQTANLPR